MSGFFRPETQKWLSRWREPVIAAIVALVGGRILWRGYIRYDWMLQAIGLILLLGGLAAFWAAYRRSQFGVGGLGPGLVEVTERRISFMTAAGGDFVDITAITRLEIRTTIAFGRVWVLKQSEGATLFIPLDATGSDTLFDAFSALPGIDPKRLIAAVNATGDSRDIIWRAQARFRALT